MIVCTETQDPAPPAGIPPTTITLTPHLSSIPENQSGETTRILCGYVALDVSTRGTAGEVSFALRGDHSDDLTGELNSTSTAIQIFYTGAALDYETTSSLTPLLDITTAATDTAAGGEAVLLLTIPVRDLPDYTPPVLNPDWSMAGWTKQPDGSYSHAPIEIGDAHAITISADNLWRISPQAPRYNNPEYIGTSETLSFLSATRSNNIFNLQGVAVGHAVFHLSLNDGTTTTAPEVFKVPIVSTPRTASSGGWYLREGKAGSYSYSRRDGVGIDVDENEAEEKKATVIFYTQELNSRTPVLTQQVQSPATSANVRLEPATPPLPLITIDGGTHSVRAYDIYASGVGLDYETLAPPGHPRDVELTFTETASVPEGTSHAAWSADLGIALRIHNITEPPVRTSQTAPNALTLRVQGSSYRQPLGGFWRPVERGRTLTFQIRIRNETREGEKDAVPHFTAANTGETLNTYNTWATLSGAYADLQPVSAGSGDYAEYRSYDGLNHSEDDDILRQNVTFDARALAAVNLVWGSGVTLPLTYSRAENVAVPALLASNLKATASTTDQSATLGEVSLTLGNTGTGGLPSTTLDSGGAFRLRDAASGEEGAKDLYLVRSLDFETHTQILAYLTATIPQTHSAQGTSLNATITLNVTDVNERPSFLRSPPPIDLSIPADLTSVHVDVDYLAAGIIADPEGDQFWIVDNFVVVGYSEEDYPVLITAGGNSTTLRFSTRDYSSNPAFRPTSDHVFNPQIIIQQPQGFPRGNGNQLVRLHYFNPRPLVAQVLPAGAHLPIVAVGETLAAGASYSSSYGSRYTCLLYTSPSPRD